MGGSGRTAASACTKLSGIERSNAITRQEYFNPFFPCRSPGAEVTNLPKELGLAMSLVSTGVEGLDEILGGGLPPSRLYLVQGNPGSGKTTLGLQFLLDGVRRAERCLYISLSETKAELRGVADSHGWSIDDMPVFDLLSEERNLARDDHNTL